MTKSVGFFGGRVDGRAQVVTFQGLYSKTRRAMAVLIKQAGDGLACSVFQENSPA